MVPSLTIDQMLTHEHADPWPVLAKFFQTEIYIDFME